MNDPDRLHLHEEILLLALQDGPGTVVSGAWYRQAVAGALLAELKLLERLRQGEDGKAIEVADATPVGEPLLDDCLAQIVALGKSKPLRALLEKLANQGELKHRAAEGLCRRGILRADRERILLFFERRVYPERDARPEAELIERLRAAVFDENADVEPRTVVILSLAHRTNILKAVFDRKLLKAHRARIEAVIRGEATGSAAKQVLEAIQGAALVAACIVPTISS